MRALRRQLGAKSRARNIALTQRARGALRLVAALTYSDLGAVTAMLPFDKPQMMPHAQTEDEQVSAFFRSFLPDFYFVNTPLSRMRRHLQLLRALPDHPLQIEFYRAPGAQFTELILCAYDRAQPGLLAEIAGALTALRVSVHTAWIHTLCDPHSLGENQNCDGGVILDTLIVSESRFRRTRPLAHKTEEATERALRANFASPDSSLGARAAAPLKLRELSVSAAGQYTLIKVSAPDETGVLFRVARAVAQLGLNIAHAQINTFENAAADTFFVTDADGQPLDGARFNDVKAQLEAALQS